MKYWSGLVTLPTCSLMNATISWPLQLHVFAFCAIIMSANIIEPTSRHYYIQACPSNGPRLRTVPTEGNKQYGLQESLLLKQMAVIDGVCRTVKGCKKQKSMTCNSFEMINFMIFRYFFNPSLRNDISLTIFTSLYFGHPTVIVCFPEESWSLWNRCGFQN